MKRILPLLLAFAVVGGVAFAQMAPTPERSKRTDLDFVKIILSKGWGDKVDAAGRIGAANMDDPNGYFFFPVLKNGSVVGYAWWTKDVRIASHYEDMIMIINRDGTLKYWWVSANEKHPDMQNDKVLAKFAGMSHDRNWDEKVDVISKSTFSSYMYFANLKATLLAFKLYVIDANKLPK